MSTPTIPAAWLVDPSTPGQYRYWDGSQWTDNTSPMTPIVPGPPVPSAGACKVCGVVGRLRAENKTITSKKRAKFGVFWLLFSILTGGVGILIWLILPRKHETIGVDRSIKCLACGSVTA
jgi:hypothetical protein